MKAIVLPEVMEVIKSDYYRPAISITMPFEPKMDSKATLAHSLKIATDKVEEQLTQHYTAEISQLIMLKIRDVISKLNYDTHKKSIAIYVSPVFEKVLYLDMPLEERIIVDDSFEIRDLIYSKKQEKKYLVLLLSSKQSSIYLAHSNKFERIVCNSHPSDYSFINRFKEKVANFTDITSHRETLMDKFLLNTDNVLDIIVEAYRLPLFVMGNEKIIGHFKSITKHAEHIIEYFNGNYFDASTELIKNVLQLHTDDWEKIKQTHLLLQLEGAIDKAKMVSGIRNVWREANNHNARLLLVEKDFIYPAKHGSAGVIHKALDANNQFSYVKDAVDDIIEKVLEYGGDVEFVDNDVLKDYRRIALIKFH